MAEAFGWGLLAASSLLVGATAALRLPLFASEATGDRGRRRDRLVGAVTGFGGGALISAVSIELTQDAFRDGGSVVVASGLAVGAGVYVLLSRLIDPERPRRRAQGPDHEHIGRNLELGIVLDGIPESIVLGTSLIGGNVSASLIVAVFLSNVPEALTATSELRRAGRPARGILLQWTVIALVSGVAAAGGFALEAAPQEVVAFIQTFAAGAIVAMLANALFPVAHGDREPIVGFATAAGFCVSFLLSVS